VTRPKVNVDPKTVEKAKEELEKIKDSKLSIQLKAIIAAAEHPVEHVADILKVSARSIFRWITKFKEGSVHKKEIEQWIVSGKNGRGETVHWTLQKLKRELEKKFGVDIGKTPLWKHLKKMGLVLKTPRPVHAKADINAQEDFKKN